MKHKRKLLWLAPLLLVLSLGSFLLWATNAADPEPEALSALVSDTEVTVTTDDWITFSPAGKKATVGLIFYPGGRVDPRAYAPAARAIAQEGYQVTIVPMPLNLAFFNPDAADEVIAAYPHIERWAISGHSLGGAMAAQYVYNQPQNVDGLALWAAYPADNVDLSGYDLDVVAIFGTRDGLASEAEVQDSAYLLPTMVDWHPIPGGNHAQFGWYGAQPGDNPATISHEAQQAEIVKSTLALLERLELQ